MKKLLFLLAVSAKLFAASVGNPASPQLIHEGFYIPCNSWIDLRLGYEGDFIGDGRMKQRVEGTGRVDNYMQDTNSGTITLNFLDRFDIYGVFGSSRTYADWRFSMASIVKRVQLETRYRFFWAIGGRAILYEWGCAIFGIGGRYTGTNSKPSWMTTNGEPQSTKGSYMRWREWQVDLDLAYKIDIFIPYIGVKYSDANVNVGPFSTAISNSGSGELHMQNRNPVGLVIGCTLTTGRLFMLNIEGRLIDEEALTISGDIRF